MKNTKQPSIDGKQFQIKMDKWAWITPGECTDDDTGIKMQVMGLPRPCTVENKSKWQVVNWWRKLIGTYYEYGYKYTVKVVEQTPIGKPGKTKYTLADDDPEKIILKGTKVVGKIDVPEIKKKKRNRK